MQRLRGVRVLHVDDDDTSLDVARHFLEREGALCTSVGTAEEALASMRQSPPDAIVVDLMMPVRDGFWLVREVRRLPPERGGRCPAIALSANDSHEALEACFAAGFQLHVSKPLTPENLVQAVLAVMGWD
jgi:CheY-like chemotaxis protein